MGKLRVNLNGLELKNPIMTASGTYGYASEYNDFIDVSKIGAVVTKAISLYPRAGNKHVRITETKAGMINSIGLENVGIDKFIENKLSELKENNIDFVMNVAGSTIDEYVQVAKKCNENNIKAIELNVSCPNVKSGCLEFGTDENSLYELVSAVRAVYNGFLIVKLTPNVTSIEKLGIAAEKAGANAISAINTLKGTSIKFNLINGKFYKIQCKTSKKTDDIGTSIEFSCRSSHRVNGKCVNEKYTSEDVDFFATTYQDKCYLIP